MKYFFYILIFGFLLFCSCRTSVETIIFPYQYSPKDSIYIDRQVYEVKSSLYSLLDSIIEYTDSCPVYIDSKGRDFIFKSYYDDYDDFFKVSVSRLWNSNFDHTPCRGVFYYRTYRFYYFGDTLDSFVTKTNKEIRIKCVDPKKIIIDKNDTNSFWLYAYASDSLKCIYYSNCGNWWIEQEYDKMKMLQSTPAY